MSLASMATETLQLCFQYLGTERNILTLMRGNRHLYAVGLPILYRHNIRHSRSSAIHWCAETGNERVALHVLKFNPDIDTPLVADLSPLRLAIDGGHIGMVKLLLEYGARADNALLIHRAVMTGNKDLVQILLDSGGDANSLDGYGQTPLKDAAGFGNREIVQLLFDYGADINLADRAPSGVTPLHSAAEHETEDPELLRLLLNLGARIDARDNSGETALHWAASRPFPSHLKVLLECGADIDPRNTRGETPLHRAAMTGQDANMQLLQDYGANSNAVNFRGLTPVQVYGDLLGSSIDDMPRID